MKILVALLIISILGNLFGLFVLFKFFKKDTYVKELEAKLERKDQVIDEVGKSLPTKMVFLHHSVGRNWLADGLKQELAALGVSIQSISRNCDLGMDTDFNHWVPKFSENFDAISKFDATKENNLGDYDNEIIMFKSCYPNSDIISTGAEIGNPVSPEKTISNYQSVMDSLKAMFSSRPDQKFIFVTTPPICRSNTNAENAARARDFNNWILNDFQKSYKETTGLDNFYVFDLYGLLAGTDNMLKPEYTRREGDSHPNEHANRVATKAFVKFYKENFI